MGRSFKLQNRRQPKKKYAKQEDKEVKVVYDHRPQVKTNPKIIADFMKNSLIPSELWDGPTEHEKLYGKIVNDSIVNVIVDNDCSELPKELI
jgi:hypothetical protein